jgi:hypothetical protein
MRRIILSEIDNDGRGPNQWEYDAGDGSTVSVVEGDLIQTVGFLMAQGIEVTLRSIDWWESQHAYEPGEKVEVDLTTETFQGPIVRRVGRDEKDDDVGPMYVMEIHVYEDEITKRVGEVDPATGREAR